MTVFLHNLYLGSGRCTFMNQEPCCIEVYNRWCCCRLSSRRASQGTLAIRSLLWITLQECQMLSATPKLFFRPLTGAWIGLCARQAGLKSRSLHCAVAYGWRIRPWRAVMDLEIRETCRAPEVCQNAVSDILVYTITVICTVTDILCSLKCTQILFYPATCLLCLGPDGSWLLCLTMRVIELVYACHWNDRYTWMINH